MCFDYSPVSNFSLARDDEILSYLRELNILYDITKTVCNEMIINGDTICKSNRVA